MPKRPRCGRCRSRIDPDLYTCPFCGEEDPLRYRRVRKWGLFFTVVVAASAAAWVFLA